MRPTTEHVYTTCFRQVSLAHFTLTPDVCHFPGQAFQVGEGCRGMALNFTGLTAYTAVGHHGWLTMVSQDSPHSLGEGLVSPKWLSCCTQQTLASARGTFGAKFEAWQAEENMQLKDLSSQRQVPEVTCSFYSAFTQPWTPGISPFQENPTPPETAAHWTGEWAAAERQEVAPPSSR